MKTMEMVKLVDAKRKEMESLLDELLKSDVSENTKRTQKFQRTKAIHDMVVISTILEQAKSDEITFSTEAQKWFDSMVTLTSERKAKYTVEVHEGDSILELLDRYKDIKDIYNKLMAAAKEKGLTIDYSVPGGILK